MSDTISVFSAETVATAGSVQSNSTWTSIFRAYGWKMEKEEEPPADNAETRSWVGEEQGLRGIGGHAENDRLEKLDLGPLILDGNTKVPGWLADDSLPLCLT